MESALSGASPAVVGANANANMNVVNDIVNVNMNADALFDSRVSSSTVAVEQFLSRSATEVEPSPVAAAFKGAVSASKSVSNSVSVSMSHSASLSSSASSSHDGGVEYDYSAATNMNVNEFLEDDPNAPVSKEERKRRKKERQQREN